MHYYALNPLIKRDNHFTASFAVWWFTFLKMVKTKTTPRKSDIKGHLPRRMGESIAGTAAKTSYRDPLLPPSRTGRPSGNPSYLGKYMYLLS